MEYIIGIALVAILVYIVVRMGRVQDEAVVVEKTPPTPEPVIQEPVVAALPVVNDQITDSVTQAAPAKPARKPRAPKAPAPKQPAAKKAAPKKVAAIKPTPRAPRSKKV